ncbi:hypothetical protein BN977_05270 [Mycolicibacterium cosmeticum]|uniref:Uncharacterized protein n=1 Tax=Mycolicibacterium cosmeticum TaxID=258533 RepID=W9B5Y1_MYCCO|nr:hypothetical protein BN977_05270 [Mycolicibacterium cosmeticum]
MVVVSAALVAVLALAEIASGPHQRDDASFRAGYAAASNGTMVRAAMTEPGVTPTVFCDALAEKNSVPGIVARDFLAGCRRAVADAME